MCAVAGIYAYHYAASPVDRDELRRMRDAMRARGPDGRGEWFSDDGRVGLAHRRLSIIDLSDAAAQPMTSPSGHAVVSYNGEIYNFRELRVELERSGVPFATQSDTEVLLAAFEAWGEGMFDRLRGMYALALWDARRQALLLARDPYGIKPLYVADDGWTARVASQVRALHAGGGVSHAREPAGDVGFYLFGSIPEPFTLYRDVRAVPAGTVQWVDELGPRAPRAHFLVPRSLRPTAEPMAADEVVDRVRAAVSSSVAAHRVADVPVGLFLSAGIDSGAILGFMTGSAGAPILSTTVGFDEFAGGHDDETVVARVVAARFGADHVERRVDRREFQNDLPRILDAMDQPSIDGINTWFAAKACAERGLKVAVSGVGGDELFGGYDSFARIPRWRRRAQWSRWIPGLGGAVRRATAPVLRRGGAISPKAAGMLELGRDWPGAYLLARGLFMPWELERLLPRDVVVAGLERLQWRDRLAQSLEPDPGTDFGRVAALEAQHYLRNQLLRDADWAGMAHGVEIRTPLVDARLLESLGPIMSRLSPGPGKAALAASVPGALPDEVRMRRKTGFGVPIARWLQERPTSSSAYAAHWSRWHARQVMSSVRWGHAGPCIAAGK